MRDDEVDAQVLYERRRRIAAMTMPTPRDPGLPADPSNPKLTDSEPAWVRYAAGTVAYVAILLGGRFGLDMEGDETLLMGFVSGPLVYAITTWRTRRKVYSPATVAKLEHWQQSDHAGGELPKSMMQPRPQGQPGGQ